MTDLIESHRLCVRRFSEALPGTVEHVEAEAALVASFAALKARYSDDLGDEDCVFLRPQVGPLA